MQELNILGLNGAYSDEMLLEAVELSGSTKKTMLPRHRSVSVQVSIMFPRRDGWYMYYPCLELERLGT